MSRTIKRPVFLLVTILTTVLMSALCLAGKGPAPLMPANAKAFGKSLEEWSGLHAHFAIASTLGGATDLDDTVGHVRLLPGTLFIPSAEFDIALPPGTPFVASPFFIFGERYDDPNVPDDNPADPIIEQIFATAEIKVLLDGRVLLEGTASELEDRFFGPVFFDEPIVYAQPQPRGPDLNAVAALFAMGIGTVFHPLPVGEHTLEFFVDSPFFGETHTTYHITVSPK